MRISPLQRVMIAAFIVFAVVFFAKILFPGHSTRSPEAASLYQAKQICVACRRYAADHDRAFPPTLDALFPKYLTDRSVLASPLDPTEPAGYTYTPPGAGKTDSPDTVVIEDKFAPTMVKERIVSYADDSARILRVP